MIGCVLAPKKNRLSMCVKKCTQFVHGRRTQNNALQCVVAGAREYHVVALCRY